MIWWKILNKIIIWFFKIKSSVEIVVDIIHKGQASPIEVDDYLPQIQLTSEATLNYLWRRTLEVYLHKYYGEELSFNSSNPRNHNKNASQKSYKREIENNIIEEKRVLVNSRENDQNDRLIYFGR